MEQTNTASRMIQTTDAPAAIGPYSQAIRTDGLLFVSGQLPIDPVSGDLVTDDIGRATRQIVRNIEAIVRAAGAALADVVKTTIFLADMNDFAAVNEVYGEYFGQILPARSTVQVAALPKNAPIEIEAVVRLPAGKEQ